MPTTISPQARCQDCRHKNPSKDLSKKSVQVCHLVVAIVLINFVSARPVLKISTSSLHIFMGSMAMPHEGCLQVYICSREGQIETKNKPKIPWPALLRNCQCIFDRTEKIRQFSDQPPHWNRFWRDFSEVRGVRAEVWKGALNFLEVALVWKFPYGNHPKQSSKKNKQENRSGYADRERELSLRLESLALAFISLKTQTLVLRDLVFVALRLESRD